MLHTHVVLPAPENEFGGHASQAALETAPSTVDHCPGWHAVHSPLPETGLNFPAMVILTSVTASTPPVHYYLQSTWMNLTHTHKQCLKVRSPASQSWQSPPLGPVFPDTQVQASIEALDDGEAEPAGQAVHVLSVVAPTPSE